MGYSNIPIGRKPPEVINAVIEIPKGTANKYEYNEESDEIFLDRVLHSSLHFPTDYGFIPRTRSGDGDHLDVMVLISEPTFPGCVVSVRPIGILDMDDEGGKDWKIIAVADTDPYSKEIKDIDDIDIHTKKKIQHFLEVYKNLEGKWVKVRRWMGKKEALKRIKVAYDKYKKEEKPIGKNYSEFEDYTI